MIQSPGLGLAAPAGCAALARGVGCGAAPGFQMPERSRKPPKMTAVSPAASVAVAQPTGSGLPATPWLSQLQDPQQALRDIQQAQATMAAPPAAVP